MSGPTQCPHCGKPVTHTGLGGLCPDCLLSAGMPTEGTADQPGPNGTKVVNLRPPLPVGDIAKHFPQLEILECLGRGGMGVVYKARQPKLNRLVALKVIAPEKGDDPLFAERFEREAQALARLNHPNIVTVYDFGTTEGLCFLIMEFVDGTSVRQLLRAGRLAPEQALAIVPRVCEALQFAHEKGVVHRDIKPENVLLDTEGRIKIADFGIAKIVGQESGRPRLTGDQQVVGTPHYMAPEQVETPARVDHRADIYSLGVVFYEMLTGELPLGRFQPPSRKVQIDVRLDGVVLHALEKEPQRRYQHASEVKTDVDTIVSHPAPASSPPAPASAVPVAAAVPRPEFWKTAVGVLALLLSVVLAGSLIIIGLTTVLPALTRAKSREPAPLGPSRIGDGVTEGAAGQTAALDLSAPPVVIKTIPESGRANVSPSLTELRATFSAPMKDGCWSWTTWGEDTFPEVAGPIRYLPDGCTCVLPVKLKPGKVYAIWLNSDKFQSFQDLDGRAAVPYLLIFQTSSP